MTLILTFFSCIFLPTRHDVYQTLNLYKKNARDIDETLVMFYTIELLKMCEDMHSHGILHGDIKPDNLLLRSDVDKYVHKS